MATTILSVCLSPIINFCRSCLIGILRYILTFSFAVRNIEILFFFYFSRHNK